MAPQLCEVWSFVACLFYRYGRPVSGTINFCPNALSNGEWHSGVDTTLHEIAHAIIMSPGLWDDFRDSNGELSPFPPLSNTPQKTNKQNSYSKIPVNDAYQNITNYTPRWHVFIKTPKVKAVSSLPSLRHVNRKKHTQLKKSWPNHFGIAVRFREPRWKMMGVVGRLEAIGKNDG